MEFKVELDRKWIVLNRDKNPNTCILCLPGRYGHAAELCRLFYRELELKDHLIVGITPVDRSWYPMPNGIYDQDEAILGLEPAKKLLEWAVSYIENNLNVPRGNIILAGHSAGAVMAIWLAAHSETAFKGVLSFSGAILDPYMLPACQHPTTNFLLTHCRDDMIFEWYERYVPMKLALKEMGYSVWTVEEALGSHGITDKQQRLAKVFIETCFKE
jgi:predicted esterase